MYLSYAYETAENHQLAIIILTRSILISIKERKKKKTVSMCCKLWSFTLVCKLREAYDLLIITWSRWVSMKALYCLFPLDTTSLERSIFCYCWQLTVSLQTEMASTQAQLSLLKILLRTFPILLVLLLQALTPSEAGSYDQRRAIHDALLSSSRYNPSERPLLDQDDVLYINVMFELVSVVEISDVLQSFKCNGFLALTWQDEVNNYS